jgi:hypothetical protein
MTGSRYGDEPIVARWRARFSATPPAERIARLTASIRAGGFPPPSPGGRGEAKMPLSRLGKALGGPKTRGAYWESYPPLRGGILGKRLRYPAHDTTLHGSLLGLRTALPQPGRLRPPSPAPTHHHRQRPAHLAKRVHRSRQSKAGAHRRHPQAGRRQGAPGHHLAPAHRRQDENATGTASNRPKSIPTTPLPRTRGEQTFASPSPKKKKASPKNPWKEKNKTPSPMLRYNVS